MDNTKETTTLTEEQRAAREKAAATPRTREEQMAQPHANVDLQTRTDVEQSIATDEGKKAQIERELKAQAELSKANEEGHAKVQERIEKAHANNKAGEQSGDGERKIPDNPTSGLEHNRNTPRVDAQGNKHWD